MISIKELLEKAIETKNPLVDKLEDKIDLFTASGKITDSDRIELLGRIGKNDILPLAIPVENQKTTAINSFILTKKATTVAECAEQIELIKAVFKSTSKI